MAITMAEIQHLRKMTGAGMMDCKNALTEAEGDFDKAMEIIRKKGQAVAAKREDREASEGCVLAKTSGNFAAIVALQCETDFVAKNGEFVALTQQILDAAIENKPNTLDELLAVQLPKGTVSQLITDKIGATGEKMALGFYEHIAAQSVMSYVHMGNKLATIVGFNKAADERMAKDIAMQVAAMNPIAIDENGVSEEIKQQEIAVAIEKTKAEQVQKAVEVALKKAGINPAHVDSEDHMDSNMAKGWISAEDVAKAKEIIATVSAEKAANLPEQMIQNITKGRLAKFFKESTLLQQEFVKDSKLNIEQYLKQNDKDLTVTVFKRVSLNA
jgi:elongation factor Ts